MEVKYSTRTKGWHVHYHILAEGTWWDKKELSALWHEVTGDSFVIDIREVTDARGGAYYGAKYATKPFDAGSLAGTEQLVEAISAFSSCRMWEIFGSWKGKLKLLAKPKDPGDWQFVRALNPLCSDARNGSQEALKLVMAVLNGEDPTSSDQYEDSS